jgi:hypothetical protein
MWDNLLGFLSYKPFGETTEELETKEIEEEELPTDFDDYSWWNPADWGGNYDDDLTAYNSRKKEELARKYWLTSMITIVIVGFGVYVIKK